ncbi:MAG: transcription-repair coupling factor [Caldisericia bacterium]|nr:transcription-repair coupling factor [Caldisericia bacterium]
MVFITQPIGLTEKIPLMMNKPLLSYFQSLFTSTLPSPFPREPIHLYNATNAVSSLFIAHVATHPFSSMLIIVPGEGDCERIYANLHDLLPPTLQSKLYIFPDGSQIPYEKVSLPREVIGEQMQVLHALQQPGQKIVITTNRAVFQPVLSPEELERVTMKMTVGEEISFTTLMEQLEKFGYRNEVAVERVGDIRIKGGLLDIFSPTSNQPARIEFFENQIQSIRFFDPVTQLSIEKTESYSIIPFSHFLYTREAIQQLDKKLTVYFQKNPNDLSDIIQKDLVEIKQGIYFSGIEHYLPFSRDEEKILTDYFSEDSFLFLVQPTLLEEGIKLFQTESYEIVVMEREKREILSLPWEKYFQRSRKKLESFPKTIRLSSSPLNKTTPQKIALPIHSIEGLSTGDYKSVIQQYSVKNHQLIICTKQYKRVKEILTQIGLEGETHSIVLVDSYLSDGFHYPSQKVTLLTDKELFGWKRPHKPVRKFREGIPIQSIEDLKMGDILVHYNYGVGIYRGLKVVKDLEGKEKEFVLLEYDRGDMLYVPPERINAVNKYIGEAEHVKLNSLGSSDWERIREKAKKSVQELAKDLIALYAQREMANGTAFHMDTPWQKEMESSFPYEETPDQLVAIQDVKQDMESRKIMDRVVTGDVGYGKTEVAIRASFKAIMEGYQVALLVPTTILASQHFETFKERFAPYPINLQILSRLISDKKKKEIVRGLKEGKIDLVIGTHAILSKDLVFKNLGLLVIDEEHKFGVRHKEKIRKLKENVDVLTLTATPIPRTLSMAISGIKEISRIDTSPEGRKPVKTYVMPFDEEALVSAIRFEIARDGQVYYVHNRIKDIEKVKEKLTALLPDIRIGVAHGQMNGEEIDNIITSFLEGQIQLLLCTTIIESGIDIPTVNTILVDDAHRLGLAQMYQLRGRVGRSNRKAYAYFFYPKDLAITETATSRLEAIKEFVELGSGLKIALRDLEIRGAGNFLGSEQSGHLRAVGYHLYVQLLKEAMDEIKSSQSTAQEAEAVLFPEFPITGYIPSTMIRDEGERLALYQQLVSLQSKKELLAMEDQIRDRFGPPPAALSEFYKNLELRMLAFEKGLNGVKTEENLVVFTFKKDSRRFDLNVHHISTLVNEFGNRIRFKAEQILIRKDAIPLDDIIRGVLQCL